MCSLGVTKEKTASTLHCGPTVLCSSACCTERTLSLCGAHILYGSLAEATSLLKAVWWLGEEVELSSPISTVVSVSGALLPRWKIQWAQELWASNPFPFSSSDNVKSPISLEPIGVSILNDDIVGGASHLLATSGSAQHLQKSIQMHQLMDRRTPPRATVDAQPASPS